MPPNANVLLRADRTLPPLVRKYGLPDSSNATLGTRGGKKILGASDRRELSMKTRQRDAVHEIRAVVGSIWAAALSWHACGRQKGPAARR